jgi:long-subunit fatty acid transport protein
LAIRIMKNSMKLWLAALSLMSFGVVSEAQESLEHKRAQQAQQPVAQSITPEQQAALDKLDQDIAQTALNIVRMIDQDRAGEVWDTASPVGKKVISRDDFLKKIAHDRGALGSPGMRMPMGVRHLRYDGTGNMPAGAFVNVSFDTQFGKLPQSSREMVTFILDADNNWRFVGYAIR